MLTGHHAITSSAGLPQTCPRVSESRSIELARLSVSLLLPSLQDCVQQWMLEASRDGLDDLCKVSSSHQPLRCAAPVVLATTCRSSCNNSFVRVEQLVAMLESAAAIAKVSLLPQASQVQLQQERCICSRCQTCIACIYRTCEQCNIDLCVRCCNELQPRPPASEAAQRVPMLCPNPSCSMAPMKMQRLLVSEHIKALQRICIEFAQDAAATNSWRTVDGVVHTAGRLQTAPRALAFRDEAHPPSALPPTAVPLQPRATAPPVPAAVLAPPNPEARLSAQSLCPGPPAVTPAHERSHPPAAITVAETAKGGAGGSGMRALPDSSRTAGTGTTAAPGQPAAPPPQLTRMSLAGRARPAGTQLHTAGSEKVKALGVLTTNSEEPEPGPNAVGMVTRHRGAPAQHSSIKPESLPEAPPVQGDAAAQKPSSTGIVGARGVNGRSRPVGKLSEVSGMSPSAQTSPAQAAAAAVSMRMDAAPPAPNGHTTSARAASTVVIKPEDGAVRLYAAGSRCNGIDKAACSHTPCSIAAPVRNSSVRTLKRSSSSTARPEHPTSSVPNASPARLPPPPSPPVLPPPRPCPAPAARQASLQSQARGIPGIPTCAPSLLDRAVPPTTAGGTEAGTEAGNGTGMEGLQRQSSMPSAVADAGPTVHAQPARAGGACVLPAQAALEAPRQDVAHASAGQICSVKGVLGRNSSGRPVLIRKRLNTSESLDGSWDGQLRHEGAAAPVSGGISDVSLLVDASIRCMDRASLEAALEHGADGAGALCARAMEAVQSSPPRPRGAAASKTSSISSSSDDFNSWCGQPDKPLSGDVGGGVRRCAHDATAPARGRADAEQRHRGRSRRVSSGNDHVTSPDEVDLRHAHQSSGNKAAAVSTARDCGRACPAGEGAPRSCSLQSLQSGQASPAKASSPGNARKRNKALKVEPTLDGPEQLQPARRPESGCPVRRHANRANRFIQPSLKVCQYQGQVRPILPAQC